MPADAARFDVVLREIRYHFNDQFALEYSKRIRLRTLRDGAGFYTDKVAWTAGDPGVPTCDGFTVQPVTAMGGIWSYFRIQFDRKLQRGQEIEFELRWPELTNWPSAKPFCSTTTHEKVETLRFDLRIPRAARADDRAMLEQLRSADSPDRLARKDAVFDDRSQLLWEIPTPPVDRHFRATWHWHPIITGTADTSPADSATVATRP